MRVGLVALSSVAILVIAMQVLNHQIVAKDGALMRALRLSANQKADYEYLANTATFLHFSGTSSSRPQLLSQMRETLDSFVEVQESIRRGDRRRGLPTPTDPELVEALALAHPSYERVRDASESLLNLYQNSSGDRAGDARSGGLLDQILSEHQNYAAAMTTVERCQERLSEQHMERYQRLQLLLLGLFLIVLLLGTVFVLRPGILGVVADFEAVQAAEKELRTAEARHRALIEAAPDSMIRMSRDGVYLDVRASNAGLLYAPAEELIGRNVKDIGLPSELTDRLFELSETALRTREVQTLDYKLSVPDGVRDFEARIAPCGDDELFRVVRDVTDRRLEERALRSLVESSSAASGEEYFRILVRHVASVLRVPHVLLVECVSDIEVRTLAFWREDRFEKNFTYKLQGTPCCDVVLRRELRFHGDSVQELFPEDRELRELGIRSYLGIPVFNPKKEILGLLVAMDAAPLKEERSREWILRIFAAKAGAGIVRMQVQEAQRESEERFRATFETTAVGMAHLGTDGRWLHVNDKLQHILGYTSSEFLETDFSSLVHGEDRRESSGAFEACVSGEAPSFLVECRFFHKSGDTVWLHVTASPVRDASGAAKYFIAVLEDITERKRAEAERRAFESQVQQAQKLESIGMLAGGIAHDFNNLLTAVLGNTSLALSEVLPGGNAQESLLQIKSAATQAAGLTKQLLAYAGRGRFEVVPIDLNLLVREMAQLLGTAVSKKVSFELQLSLSLPAIEGDQSQIRQVVMNLMTNASDAMEDSPGTITLTTGRVEADESYFADAHTREDRHGPYVFVEVADTGIGMDEEAISRMFDPFFTTKFAGRGLGLAAVLGIVRSHKGAVKVRSQVGRGTVVRVLFPASAESVVPKERRTPRAGQVRGEGTILVVDDEELVRELTRSILERAGFKVLTARDGEHGLELLRQHAGSVNGVLLDMVMPRMGGEEAFRGIRHLEPELPVVLMSGHGQEEAMQRLSGMGLAGFIQKPFDPLDLLEKLRDVCTQLR